MILLYPDFISAQLHQDAAVNEKAPESQRSTFVKQLKLGKVASCHVRPRKSMKRVGYCSSISLSLSLSLLASPVSLHPLTKTDVVQRRNPEKAGARAVHGVPVHRQLQTQRFHAEEEQTRSRSHTDGTRRLFCRKANYQHRWYAGIFQFPKSEHHSVPESRCHFNLR